LFWFQSIFWERRMSGTWHIPRAGVGGFAYTVLVGISETRGSHGRSKFRMSNNVNAP